MDDLSKLRSAIANKNDGEVKKIQQSHITKIPSPKFPMKCNENEAKKIYLFSTAIIPEDIPFPNHEVMAIKVLGDGNFLFNSASFPVESTVQRLQFVFKFKTPDCS